MGLMQGTVRVRVCIYAWIDVYIDVCMCVCMYVRMDVWTYGCVCDRERE